MSFLYALLALGIGTLAGFFVQRVATSLRYNGEWPNTPDWKKDALSATGSIAAFAAGAQILSTAESFNPQDLLARMWLWQTVAAWAGATALDLAVEYWKKGGRK